MAKVYIRKDLVKDSEKNESFGSNAGGGIGCFLTLLGIAILFNFPIIIAAITKMGVFGGCK